MLHPETIIELFKMQPLEAEGGYFVETWRSEQQIESPNGLRSLGTTILYLLRAGDFSAMHRLASDEIWHFHLGDPAELLLLKQDGSSKVVTLGPDVSAGQQVQVVIPTGTWQGCRVIHGGTFALMGTTVTPGFEYEDFELGRREELLNAYPDRTGMITALTRE